MDDPEANSTREPPASAAPPPTLRRPVAVGRGPEARGRESGTRATRSNPPEGTRTSAWEAAEAYGFDMSLIEANLRRTPAERIRAHGRMLALAVSLREAIERRRAGP